MIRRNTWVLLLILAALIGFAYYVNAQKVKKLAAATPAPSTASTSLFGPEEGPVSDIRIETSAGKTVEIGRDATGAWVLKQPTSALADQAAAESAASQAQALQIISTVEIGLDIVGLDKPDTTMTFGFSAGREHTLVIGSATPVQTGYYARLDGGKVLIIGKDGVDSLLKLVTNPPVAVTPTGTAAPGSVPEPGTASPTP